MLAALTDATAGTQDEARIAAQPVSTPIYQPATQPPAGGGSYTISDDIGPIQPGTPATPAYEGGSAYGSEADATPAPVSGIEPLPPIEQ
jgi:hypothetical protein